MKRTELNKVVFNYILESIDSEDYGVTATTEKEKLQFILDCFISECWHDYNKKYYKNNMLLAFTSWLQGLPSSFNVAFENYEILQIAIKWECIKETATENQKYKIIDNWFNWIANKTFQLMKKHKVLPIN